MLMGLGLNWLTPGALAFLHPLVGIGIFLVIRQSCSAFARPTSGGALKKRKATVLALTTNLVIIPGRCLAVRMAVFAP